jgi:S-formylglutathione hydrolase FrmB
LIEGFGYLESMSKFHCEFRSEALQLATAMTVILPSELGRLDSDLNRDGRGVPTLWLLHGLSDDHTAWTRQTSIERYVSGRNLAVVMPQVDRSYYADMAHGNRYWTFISEELPRLARAMFPLSSRREDNFVAGLSMGGYGAYKLALNFPERYAAAASLSGALDPIWIWDQEIADASRWENIFGSKQALQRSESDLMRQAEQLSVSDHQDLPLYCSCGTADFIYQCSVNFRDHANTLGLNLTYHEHPGRDHTWDYWDEQIQQVIDWLPR